MNRLQSYLTFAFLLFMVLPVDLVAQGGSAPVILSVTVNYQSTPWQITIRGRNFKPSTSVPTILFNNEPVYVPQDCTDQLVVATLTSNPNPGTFLLTMTNSKKVTGTAYLTIGAEGPPGEGWDQPVKWEVLCSAGGSVNAALAEAGNRSSRTTFSITGFCNEDVNIERSNITIRAADGSPDAGFNKLNLNLGAHEIRIENLRIAHGLNATDGATFRAENLRVDQPDWGSVSLSNSASGLLINPTLTNCGCIEVQAGAYLHMNGGTLSGTSSNTAGGVSVSNGGSMDIIETVIQGLVPGLTVGTGGSVYLDHATIENGTGDAINARGSVILFGTVIRNNNGGGIVVLPGGRAEIQWGTEISGNGSGVSVRGGVLDISNATISDNHGPGIAVRSASSLSLGGITLVTGNQGDGIQLGDLSFMEVSGYPSTVTGNTGWGLYCSPAPSVAHYTVQYTGALDANGNTKGSISCVLATN